MSSVAVPKKMVPVPNVYGVEAFKELKPEMVALHPIQHKNTEFTTSGTNRISFKIPAYSNALMDTSRSFLYVKLKAAAESGLALGMPIFNRMTVKTSSGLTIEDVSDMDSLSNMLAYLKPADWETSSLYGNTISDELDRDTLTPTAGTLDTTYTEAILKFDWGIFDKKLTKFLPLFMADGGAGYSFDVDLYMSDLGLDSAGATGTLTLSSPVWYLQLMRMDEGLARRFNQMAVHGEEIRIPFNTWHTHRASVQAADQIVYIHENATNFKKILTCIKDGGQATKNLCVHESNNHDIYPGGFLGGVGAPSNKVNSYNYRVGVQHVYNEPVTETTSNVRTLAFVKQAFGIPDEVQVVAEKLALYNGLSTQEGARMFDKFRWCAVASFDYSPGERDVVQGISSSNPVELSIKFDQLETSHGDAVLNFCELGYDLVFRGGAVHYEEQKPGSQSVY
jgi:hypothetical protein